MLIGNVRDCDVILPSTQAEGFENLFAGRSTSNSGDQHAGIHLFQADSRL
jgi:hypothetical protein